MTLDLIFGFFFKLSVCLGVDAVHIFCHVQNGTFLSLLSTLQAWRQTAPACEHTTVLTSIISVNEA